MEPIKIQIDITKPLPKLPQYPLKPEPYKTSTVEKGLIAQELSISLA